MPEEMDTMGQWKGYMNKVEVAGVWGRMASVDFDYVTVNECHLILQRTAIEISSHQPLSVVFQNLRNMFRS